MTFFHYWIKFNKIQFQKIHNIIKKTNRVSCKDMVYINLYHISETDVYK